MDVGSKSDSKFGASSRLAPKCEKSNGRSARCGRLLHFPVFARLNIMKLHRMAIICTGGKFLVLVLGGAASAATSFSNSLTGFTGDSTMAATQTAVGAAGFNFFSIAGLAEDFTSDPTVTFDGNGAAFGKLFAGDGGRNYMRTNDSDYATVPFVAEITMTVGAAGGPPVSNQQPFFGMGSGDTALFGVPDWSTLFASTFVQPEINAAGEAFFTTMRTQNDANQWVNHPSPGYGAGTHRIRMTFDPVAKTMVYAMDMNYAGGPFSADVTAATVDLNHVDCPVGCGNPEMPISADFFAPDGWPGEPSRIFFGGDDEVTFKDFVVTVSAPPAVAGDYNGNGTVDAADYVVWRNGGPLLNESASIGTVDQADYDFWRSRFGATSGSGGGSVLAAGAVPEPTSLILLCLGYLVSFAVARRRVD
jgi:PEP-CTERM motif